MTNTDTIRIYSTTWCPDCKRSKKFLNEQRIPYTNIDIEKDPAGMDLVIQVNNGSRSVPTIIFPDGEIMVEPSNAKLAEKLGLHTQAQRTFYDVIIVGSGPAGLTAALYLGRENQDVLVIERSGVGGQAGITERLDNFPGFDEGIPGAEFADRLGRQAQRFGAEILQAQEVMSISRDGQNMQVTTGDGVSYGAHAVLLTTGARYRRLGVPGEESLIGVNVHFCATCDGAFYKDKKVLVVGGGNSGFEEGLFLTKFARQVDIVEFLPQVKASQILQEKVASHPRMSVTINHAVKELLGDGQLDGAVIVDRATGEEKVLDHDGIFVFIGLTPNSQLAEGLAEIDRAGFIVTDKTLMTTMPGLFAAGDVRADSTKQAASAAGEGATVALMIRQYLQELG